MALHFLLYHLNSTANIIRRASDGTKPPSCVLPDEPTIAADTRSEAPPEVNTIMAELTTLALSCERSRVATFTFSLPAAHVYYRHLSADMNDDFGVSLASKTLLSHPSKNSISGFRLT
jgi:hypothetical protein